MPAAAGVDGDGKEYGDGELGDSAVWTISPRMKDDTPRREGVPSRGALAISNGWGRFEHGRRRRRRAAGRECRSGTDVLIRLRRVVPHMAAVILFHSAREFARGRSHKRRNSWGWDPGGGHGVRGRLRGYPDFRVPEFPRDISFDTPPTIAFRWLFKRAPSERTPRA